MRLIDLSQPLYDNAPNCPVHPPVSFRRTADHPADGWRMEEIAMATHTGSHLDAPLHKIAGGKSIDALPLETFVGPARIADLRGLTADAKQKIIVPDNLNVNLDPPIGYVVKFTNGLRV